MFNSLSSSFLQECSKCGIEHISSICAYEFGRDCNFCLYLPSSSSSSSSPDDEAEVAMLGVVADNPPPPSSQQPPHPLTTSTAVSTFVPVVQGAVWHDNLCWIQALAEGFLRVMLALTIAQAASFCVAFPCMATLINAIRAGAIDGNEAEAEYHHFLFDGSTQFNKVSSSICYLDSSSSIYLIRFL
jgi:hypothetical protein